MGRHEELIGIAFELVCKQGPPEIGATVGVLDNGSPLAYKLVGIEGREAICALPDGSQMRFPLGDIADVNEVKDIAIAIYTNGQIEAMRVCESLVSQNSQVS